MLRACRFGHFQFGAGHGIRAIEALGFLDEFIEKRSTDGVGQGMKDACDGNGIDGGMM